MAQYDKNKAWLWIARMQPLHHGHVDAIKQWIQAWLQHILIGIGSANAQHTPMNPLDANERKTILLDVLEAEWLRDYIHDVYMLNDFGNNDLWRNQIVENLPEFNYLVSDNPTIEAIFPDKTFIKPVMNFDIKWTNLRQYIHQKRYELLHKHVHPKVMERLEEFKAYDRMQKILWKEWLPVKSATDLILFNKDNKVAWIQRKFAPLGLALPGWMMEYGETALECALREWLEELGGNDENEEIVVNKDTRICTRWNRSIQITHRLSYKDSPTRDPRWHTITFPFVWNLVNGELEAWDDAASFERLSIKEFLAIPLEEFALPDQREMVMEAVYKKWLIDKLWLDESEKKLITDTVELTF